MRVLMITPYLPYPLYSGGQIRSYNLIKILSKKHQISLFSFIRSEEERRHLPKLLEYCQEIKVFKRRPAFSPSSVLLAGLSFYPLLMGLYWDPKVKKEISQELESGKYDLIHAETFYVTHLLPSDLMPVVLSEQNIEWQVYKRFADRAKFFLKPLLYYDIAKIKIWEEFFWQKAKKVVVASILDQKVIEKKIGKEVGLVPNGVDLDYFKNLTPQPHRFPTILFVGNFKWLENRDAVSFLVSEVWPEIRKEIPGAKLLIVGRDAPPRLKESILASGAELKEDVQEIKDVYQITDLLLAPIRIGGGTKFKILEAMAAGVPVVTTKEGIEGLKVKDGQEVLVGKETKDLVEKVTKVLRDEDLRNNLIKKARAKVSQNYNWQIIAQSLDYIWQEAVKNG